MQTMSHDQLNHRIQYEHQCFTSAATTIVVRNSLFVHGGLQNMNSYSAVTNAINVSIYRCENVKNLYFWLCKGVRRGPSREF